MKEAKEAVGKALATLQKRFPGAASLLREAEEDVLAFMAFPEKHWRQIHSTNPLERLNREIRRRTDVVGIFPTVLSVLRLTVMLLAEQQDEWTVGRRYFSLESMAILENSNEKTLEAA
jgi:transposase-like protein